MERSFRISGLVVVLLASMAWALSSQEPTVRDSGGIRIVEYGGAAPRGSLMLSPKPVIRYGGGPTDHPFQHIWAGALQPDGGAVLADAGSREVVLLSADGTFRAVVAAKGQGPGEVASVMSLTPMGQDTFLVEDDGNAKLLVLASGRVERTLRIADYGINYGLRIHGLDGAGGALMGTSAFRPDFDGGWLRGHMARMDLATGEVDTVGTYDMVPPPNRNGRRRLFQPFGDLTASGGEFVHGRSDIPQVTWRHPDGEVYQVLRWKPTREHASPQHVSERENQLRADTRRTNPATSAASLEGLVARQLAQYEFGPSQTVPIWSGLRGDRDGRIWIGRFNGGGAAAGSSEFNVVGPDGRFVGILETPKNFRLLDAGYGRVLGVVTDEYDVEIVVVYLLDGADAGLEVRSTNRRAPTSANKQVAPTPRCARLRGTPALGFAGLEAAGTWSGSTASSGREGAPASQL